jgi:hypothetical protein
VYVIAVDPYLKFRLGAAVVILTFTFLGAAMALLREWENEHLEELKRQVRR